MSSSPFIYPVFRPQPGDACFCGSGQPFGQCCGSSKRKREPPFGVHIVRGFVDAQLCREWVRVLEQQPRSVSGVFDARRSGDGAMRTAQGSGRTSEDVAQGPLAQALNAAVARAFHHATERYGREFEWFEKPKVLRYGAGNHYGVHADNCHRERGQDFWTKMIDRDISLLLYLNQDFGGGSLSFQKFNYAHQPRAGDLVMFPSDNRYKHAANPVTSGIRYVVVSWGAYSDEPKIPGGHPGTVIPMAAFPRARFRG